MAKRKQKIIPLLFLLLMTVIVLCGCGGADADSDAALPQNNTELAEDSVADVEDPLVVEESAEQQNDGKDSNTPEPQKSAQANTEKQNIEQPKASAEQKPVAQSAPVAKPETKKEATCTISISCATVLDNMDICDPAKVDFVPKDGWILKPTKVTIQPDETVFAVLQRTCKAQKIPLEFEDTPMYNSAYIEGIYNLYEFDVGDLSGWMYSVNGNFPNYGCSQYKLQDGDVIHWLYTCDLGDDIGGSNAM